MPIILKPESEAAWLKLREEDITSTEVSALFDMSPYTTKFELWHAKKAGAVQDWKENSRMTWGKRLEAAIAHGIASDLDLNIRNVRRYMRHSDVPRMGSSFDYEIVDNKKGPGLLEIKNVDYLVYRDKWTEDEAPDHIEVQVQHQMEVADRDWCLIGVLVAGNDLKYIERERDRDVGDGLRDAVNEFWQSIECDAPPDPDFERDAAFIGKLLTRGGGPAVNLSGNARAAALAESYTALAERATEYDKAKSALRAELLWMIGDADSALLDGFKISAKTVEGADIAYTRDPYRGFRLTKSKSDTEKKEAA